MGHQVNNLQIVQKDFPVHVTPNFPVSLWLFQMQKLEREKWQFGKILATHTASKELISKISKKNSYQFL